MADLRIECPHCGTSFHAGKLGLKTGPEDEVIIRCLCGVSLEASFEHEEVVVEGSRIAEFFGRPRKRKKVIHARVNSSTG